MSRPTKKKQYPLRPFSVRPRVMLRRLRNVALSLPVVITVNDCVVSVARTDAADLPGRGLETDGDDGDGARGVPSSSSSSNGDSAYVLLNRTATRLLNFARGDMVYMKTPMDPGVRAVRRLVALEGDWVTDPSSDDVQKIPKGHCRLERVDDGLRVKGLGFRNADTWHTGTTGTTWRGKGDMNSQKSAVRTDTNSRKDSRDAATDESENSTSFSVVPIALLDSKVLFVLWPPSRFGFVDKEIPPGRVLMRDDGSE